MEELEGGTWSSDRDWKSLFSTETGSGLGRGVLQSLPLNVPIFEMTCRLLYQKQPLELVYKSLHLSYIMVILHHTHTHMHTHTHTHTHTHMRTRTHTHTEALCVICSVGKGLSGTRHLIICQEMQKGPSSSNVLPSHHPPTVPLPAFFPSLPPSLCLPPSLRPTSSREL